MIPAIKTVLASVKFQETISSTWDIFYFFNNGNSIFKLETKFEYQLNFISTN